MAKRIQSPEQIGGYVGQEYGKSRWLTIHHTIEIEVENEPAGVAEMLRMHMTRQP